MVVPVIRAKPAAATRLVDAQRRQQLADLGRQRLADAGPGEAGGALHQRDVDARRGQRDGHAGTGGAAAHHQDVAHPLAPPRRARTSTTMACGARVHVGRGQGLGRVQEVARAGLGGVHHAAPLAHVGGLHAEAHQRVGVADHHVQVVVALGCARQQVGEGVAPRSVLDVGRHGPEPGDVLAPVAAARDAAVPLAEAIMRWKKRKMSALVLRSAQSSQEISLSWL
jgi:hypothetical protein